MKWWQCRKGKIVDHFIPPPPEMHHTDFELVLALAMSLGHNVTVTHRRNPWNQSPSMYSNANAASQSSREPQKENVSTVEGNSR